MVLKRIFTVSPVTYSVVHFRGVDDSYIIMPENPFSIGLCLEEDSEPSYFLAITNLGAPKVSVVKVAADYLRL